MLCSSGIRQKVCAWFMIATCSWYSVADTGNQSPLESTCLTTLNKHLQTASEQTSAGTDSTKTSRVTAPMRTAMPTVTAVSRHCAPLQDGSKRWVALAVIAAESAGANAQQQPVFYDLYWLLLDQKLNPISQQWQRQAIRSQQDSEQGEWLKVEIDNTPYWFGSNNQTMFGVRSYYHNQRCATCLTNTETVLLDLFNSDGQQIQRALPTLPLLQQRRQKTDGSETCSGSKQWSEILPTFSTGADGYPHLIVNSYQAKLVGTSSAGTCAEDDDSVTFEQRRYRLKQHQLQEIPAEERTAQDMELPCDNGAFGKLMLTRFTGKQPQRMLCAPLFSNAESAMVAVFTPSEIPGKFDLASGDGEMDLHLFQIDYWGDIQAQGFVPAIAYTNAYELTNLQFDLNLYQLAVNQQGFAIRSMNSNSRCNSCNAWEETERLDLFIVAGAEIHWVLRDINMQFIHTEGICFDDDPGRRRTSTLTILQQAHQGFFDLKLTTQIEDSPGTDVTTGQQCRAPGQSRQEALHYQFDGQQYRAVSQP